MARLVSIIIKLLIIGSVIAFFLWCSCLSCTWDAVKRNRQKKAVTDMKYIARALEEYRNNKGYYPLTRYQDNNVWHFVPAREIFQELEKVHYKNLSQKDLWGNSYFYASSATRKSYCLISYGSNKRFESSPIPMSPVDTHCYESDAIIINGIFLKAPSGKQHSCGKNVQ